MKLCIDPALEEVAALDIFDANVRVGHSGIHGDLALEAPELIAEMDRFGIRQGLVSHFASEEYDANEGNQALSECAEAHADRLVPAWAALPDDVSIRALSERRPRAVRISPSAHKHNFSAYSWCAGDLFDYLQQNYIVALITREDVEWEALVKLLDRFPRLRVLLLETGYRADRYLFPLLGRFQNLYFDGSTYVAHRQLEAYVNRFGADRLVFGSRLPLYTPGSSLGVLLTARISVEQRAAIAGRTLRRLLETNN